MTSEQFHDLRRAGHQVAMGQGHPDKFVRPAFAQRIGEIERYNGVDYKVTSFIHDVIKYAVMEKVS